MVEINTSKCLICGGCIDLCPKTAVSMVDNRVMINSEKCSECRICVQVCPMSAPFVV